MNLINFENEIFTYVVKRFYVIQISFSVNPNTIKMLNSKYLLSIFNRNFALSKARFSSKTPEKLLGYQEKPDELMITADYIGKLIK